MKTTNNILNTNPCGETQTNSLLARGHVSLLGQGLLKATLIAGALMMGATGANAWTTSPMLWQGGGGGSSSNFTPDLSKAACASITSFTIAQSNEPSSTHSSALTSCINRTTGGTDWYLPSQEQLSCINATWSGGADPAAVPVDSLVVRVWANLGNPTNAQYFDFDTGTGAWIAVGTILNVRCIQD